MIEGRVPSQVEQNYLKMQYEHIGEQVFISMFVLEQVGRVDPSWIEKHKKILAHQFENARMFGFNPKTFEEQAKRLLSPEPPKLP